MKSSLSEIKSWLSGAYLTADAAFSGISTNSKTVQPGNLFIALRGERFDAHDFIGDVAAAGAAAVLVERSPKNVNIPAIVVADTRVALQELGQGWRRKFSFPVVGVTGSNGKTTVKEMIAAILAAEYGDGHYLATRGNLNNDIGVPLTMLRADSSHQAAVIEMGMNHPGEIALLAAIAQPTIGLVNNAQREHLEFMHSVEAVARENGAVISSLPSDGIAVFPADDTYAGIWKANAKASGKRKILTFGLSGDSSVTCTYQPTAAGSDLQVKVGDKTFPLRLSVFGVHNVRNALAAIACGLALGIHRATIVRALEGFVPVSGRLQRKQARNGAVVIDDTYNANPDSVRVAIDVLAQATAPRILVLGDMGEVGSEGRQFHIEIGAYARGRGIDHLLTLGDLASHTSIAFGGRAKHAKDIEELKQAVSALALPNATVLVKGSRFMKMERVVQHLCDEPVKESH
jgi:UDP-N-acetylmuramoyl-tripeptide--D-alanyl-D-alanine ligase